MVSRRRIDPAPWLAALVAAAALAAFAPALDNGFVGWDDDVYLLDNPAFRGLGLTQLRWAFTTTLGGLYQPLTWLSFSLDHALYGLQPWGYHLTNILLHAAAGALLFFALDAILEAASPSSGRDARAYAAAGAALLWAVHPLRVESVAWAVERKDVLAGVLWLGALLAYLRRRVRLSLVLFGLSLGAKVSGVGLPVALAALDYFPLRRRAWREKAAYAALSAGAVVVTLAALRHWGQANAPGNHPLAYRAGQAAYGLWFYPLKTLWPARLLPYYPPRPWFGSVWPQAASLLFAALAAAAALWALRRRAPAVTAAAAAYAALVAPGLGIVQNALPFAVCDRYSYLPAVAFAALSAGGLFAAARRLPRAAPVAAGLAAVLLGALSAVQTRTWRDSEALWSRAATLEPESTVAANNYGVALAARGLYARALPCFTKAASEPWYSEARLNLGLALTRLGRRDEAETALRGALRSRPDFPRAQLALGALRAGDGPAAAAEAEALLGAAAAGGEPAARSELAGLLLGQGRRAEAERLLRAALAQDPQDAAAAVNLGLLLDGAGKRAEARASYRLALRDTQWRAAAHYNLGNLLLASGRDDEAAFHFRSALLLDPDLARAHVNWGNLLARRGRLGEAAAHYRSALKRDPRLREARVNLSAVERFLRAR